MNVKEKKLSVRNISSSDGLAHVYLLVGEGGLFKKPTLVQTVLGSCVAVSMYSKKFKWGAIFHALLPRQQNYKSTREDDYFRYVDSSIYYLFKEFMRAGINPKSLECKVFGGGSPLNYDHRDSTGNQNAKVALEILAKERIKVSAACLGGNQGRKLFFRTDTGLILQKRFKV